MKKFYQEYKRTRERFGITKGLMYLLDQLINKFVYFDCWSIIVLKRDEAILPKGIDIEKLSTRFAVYEDLMALQAEGTWNIDLEKFQLFREGDRCLLSCVNGDIGGYTWAHLDGRPQVKKGLWLKIPLQYVYNYAGFTSPKFRGMKLQPYRHYMLINQEEWKDKAGLLGYVKYINWKSKRGQQKSGYQSVGLMWLVRFNNSYYVYLTKKLKRLDISYSQEAAR